MPKLPVIKPKELIKILKQLGFSQHRKSRGSHIMMTHSDGRRVVVPAHYGKDVPNGTLLGIIRDLNISKEEFIGLL